MKRILLTGVTCLFICSCGLAKNKVEKKTLSFEGRELTYYLFVPEELDRASPAALLVTLHGSGRNGKSLVDYWKDLAVQNQMIVVGPDAANNAGWEAPVDGPDAIEALVDQLKGEHNIDGRRVYLFGHSAGAGFALMMAIVEPEYFAAAAVHAGGLMQPDDLSPFFTLSERKPPLAIWIGDEDRVVPLQMVSNTSEVLKKGGFEVSVEVLKGHDHSYYTSAGKINELVWEFLSQHKLPDDPVYTRHSR